MENEKVVAFLDINPLHPGHTLIVPKAHYASLDQLPAALAGSSSFLLHR
jgi:histidine triad (HIT) family protein